MRKIEWVKGLHTCHKLKPDAHYLSVCLSSYIHRSILLEIDVYVILLIIYAKMCEHLGSSFVVIILSFGHASTHSNASQHNDFVVFQIFSTLSFLSATPDLICEALPPHSKDLKFKGVMCQPQQHNE